MKKTERLLLLLVVMAITVICLAGCGSNVVDIKEYGEKDLNMVGHLVQWMYQLIKNYGWTVVVFTIALKLLMVPFDYWQRVSMRKSSLKMQKMQPQVDQINKQYGANSQRANAELQKLYSKQGVSTLSSCLPLIITMAVFFVMFGGLNSYSKYNSVTTYRDLDYCFFYAQNQKIAQTAGYESYALQNVSETYSREDRQMLVEKINEFGSVAHSNGDDALRNEVKAYGQQQVALFYENNHESWLWIQNVWQPDTWNTIMADYKTFSATVSLDSYYDAPEDVYNFIRDAVLSTGSRGENGSWNGLMVLPILSVGLSFLSIWISQRLENKKKDGEGVANTQQNATNKSMLIMMPLMMAFFGFKYTGAFAIYMVVNYVISIISTVCLRGIVEKNALKALEDFEKTSNTGKASYMR